MKFLGVCFHSIKKNYKDISCYNTGDTDMCIFGDVNII